MRGVLHNNVQNSAPFPCRRFFLQTPRPIQNPTPKKPKKKKTPTPSSPRRTSTPSTTTSPPSSTLDCRVVAAAFTTYGGWGDDFKKTLVDPYYKKEFKAARKNVESGWAVINDRLRYERHVAAVICRENSRMLSSTLDARCRARAIQLSALQRSPVADSDTDP